MPEPTRKPTFKIVTGALKAIEDESGSRTLHCTASSSITDRHGDEITEDCIRDMAKQAVEKAMTIFLNHHYIVPEDVIAKTFSSQVINRAANDDGSQIWDLDLDIEMVRTNDRADKTWSLIKEDKVKLGVSIGAMIEEWDYKDKEAGFWGGLQIKKVDLLEASIVGIPANQRSWVQNAVKAIKSFTTSAKSEETEETEMPTDTDVINPMTLSTDPASVEEEQTPGAAPESVEAAAEPETQEIDPESSETPQELPAIEAALEGESETDTDSEDAGEVSDEDIVLALTLTIDDLKAQLKQARSEIEALRTQNSELADYVKDADAVLQTVAKTPIGRKTSVAKTVDSFHSRISEIYGDEVAKFLEI